MYFYLDLGIGRGMPGYDPEIFTDFVFRFLPDIPQFRSLFYGIVKNLRSQSTGILALVSAATALWSASGGVTNIQKGLVKITPGAEKSLRDKPAALVCTVILVVLIPVVLIFILCQKFFVQGLTAGSVKG